MANNNLKNENVENLVEITVSKKHGEAAQYFEDANVLLKKIKKRVAKHPYTGENVENVYLSYSQLSELMIKMFEKKLIPLESLTPLDEVEKMNEEKTLTINKILDKVNQIQTDLIVHSNKFGITAARKNKSKKIKLLKGGRTLIKRFKNRKTKKSKK